MCDICWHEMTSNGRAKVTVDEQVLFNADKIPESRRRQQ